MGVRRRTRVFTGARSPHPERLHRPSGTLPSWQHGAEFVRCTGCPQPVEASMRWLVGWSSTAAVAAKYGTGPGGYGAADSAGVGNGSGSGAGAGYAAGATGYDGESVHPVGSQLL